MIKLPLEMICLSLIAKLRAKKCEKRGEWVCFKVGCNSCPRKECLNEYSYLDILISSCDYKEPHFSKYLSGNC